MAAISEWLNAVFKWLLFGGRPYWWVNENKHLFEAEPTIMQFRLTCETGPGNPSGHAMVTCSVWYLMVTAIIHYKLTKEKSGVLKGLCWTVFLVVLVCVNISRCFIAAHFPHQVLLGSVVGVTLAYIFNHISTHHLTLKHHVTMACMILTSSLVVFYILEWLGYDPAWTFPKAKKWCANPEWVYMDTSPFFALVRDYGSLVGLGIATVYENEELQIKRNIPEMLIQITLALSVTLGSEYIKIPQDSAAVFYVLAFTKYTLLPFVVIVVIPQICLTLFNSMLKLYWNQVHVKSN